MIANTGWTWDYVEEQLDIPRLAALNAYWRNHPPVHYLLAAFVGFKPPRERTVNSDQELAALFGALHRMHS